MHISILQAARMEHCATRHANDEQMEQEFNTSKRDVRGHSGKRGMGAGPSGLHRALIFG